MTEIQIKKANVEGISCLIFSGEVTEPAPLVFFVHGVASDNRQGIPMGFEMARKGFIFVSLDTILRGERKDQIFDPGIGGDFGSHYPEETWLDELFTMIRMIRQTDLDLKVLIEHFQHDPRVDLERIGMVGYSMGGWATFYNMAVNPRIKAAVAVAGIPSFEKRWNDMILEVSTNPEWSDSIVKNAEETSLRTDYIREMDPFPYLLKENNIPLLMICGDLDRGPKISCLDLYGKITQNDQQKTNHLKMSIYDGIDHQLLLPMAEEAAEWLLEIFSD